VLCCVVLCCVVLCSVVLCCVVLWLVLCPVLCCVVVSVASSVILVVFDCFAVKNKKLNALEVV